MDLFHPKTQAYLKIADIKHRKKLGQYFTPKHIQEKLFSLLPKFNKTNISILDPACGTGEFLLTAQKHYPNASFSGWEYDENVFNIAKEICPFAEIQKKDSLLSEFKEEYDLVIGNPPYFEEKPNQIISNRYSDIISGRYNIFAAFIFLGLKILKPGGVLAYVLPPSMNNGSYFRSLREYIVSNSEIFNLEILDKSTYFDSAQQLTMVLVLRKKTSQLNKYVLQHKGLLIFTNELDKLSKEINKGKSLLESGYFVRTGRVVWNQKKEALTDDSSFIPLIWADNIQENKLVIGQSKKPQYININLHPNIGPAIVVNRITGASKNVKIKAAIIPSGFKFFAENHINVIFPNQNIFSKPSQDIEKEIEIIHKTITNESTSRLFSMITGNTQVSKTELENFLRIDL